ncbi:MAG: FliH/SctL family protein [Desulfofustis sp.]|jgi:flagellar assembly protein FliH|nr:FliH/SctL family protein [Desulfofustis sp.]
MSLSRVFKGQAGFVPEQLVPRPSAARVWQPEGPPRQESRQSAGPAAATAPPPAPEPEEAAAPPERPVSAPESPAATAPADAAGHDAAEDQPQSEQPPAAPPPEIDLEAIRQESFQQGLRHGHQEGLAQAEQDFGAAIAALQQTCEQLNTLRDTILKNSRDEIIELIFALAEAIIRQSVREQDTTITATVEQALSQAVRSSDFTLYLHPDDVAAIKDRVPDLIAGVNGLEHLAVKQDAAIERGGCRIESETCTVDATIAGQLDIIREQIKKQHT